VVSILYAINYIKLLCYTTTKAYDYFYSYTVLEFRRAKDMEDKLNQYGKDGWRVISVVSQSFGGSILVTLEKKL